MKRALVTGGSGDIGKAICLELASKDIYVFVHGYKNLDKAQSVVEAIQQNGGRAEVISFDVTNRNACEDALAGVCKEDPMDIVVNNAGICIDAPMAGMDHDAWHRVIDVSLHGFFNVTQPLLLPMISARRGGRIITVTSVVGITGNRGQANYAAAKAAIHGATKSLALELASRKITVNAVAPGIIDGGMALGKFDAATLNVIVPMRRAGKVEEISSMVSFLASEDASYITGQIISINGGMA